MISSYVEFHHFARFKQHGSWIVGDDEYTVAGYESEGLMT